MQDSFNIIISETDALFHYCQNTLQNCHTFSIHHTSKALMNYENTPGIESSLVTTIQNRKSNREFQTPCTGQALSILQLCINQKKDGKYTYPIGGGQNELSFFLVRTDTENKVLAQLNQNENCFMEKICEGEFNLFFDFWANRGQLALIVCRDTNRIRKQYRNAHKLCLIESGAILQNIALFLTEKNINHCLYGDIDELLFYKLLKCNRHLPLISLIIP